MKKAITFGVFDLLHFGHFELFRRIRELVGPDGKVYVMLQIDEMIEKYKPGCKNVYDFATRQKMIETLRTVDKAIPYDCRGRGCCQGCRLQHPCCRAGTYEREVPAAFQVVC